MALRNVEVEEDGIETYVCKRMLYSYVHVFVCMYVRPVCVHTCVCTCVYPCVYVHVHVLRVCTGVVCMRKKTIRVSL